MTDDKNTELTIKIRGITYEASRILCVSGEIVWYLCERGTRLPLYGCVRSPIEPAIMTIICAVEHTGRVSVGTIPDRFYHGRHGGQRYRPMVRLTDASGTLCVLEE